MGNTLAECTVAYLVVGLQKGNKGLWRQMNAHLATHGTIAIGGYFPLIGKPFRQAASQMAYRIVGVIHIVSIVLLRREYMQGVMNIIIPLRVVPAVCQITSIVGIIFQDQMHVALCIDLGTYTLRDLDKDVRTGIVDDRMYCIEPQSIEVILLQPVQRVMNEEIPYLAA